MSTLYQKALQETVFREVASSWVAIVLQWCIDSKFRTMKSVSRFLAEQIERPDPVLQDLALHLKNQSRNQDHFLQLIEEAVAPIRYETDQMQFGMQEKWATAAETWKLRKDDCDGKNGLIYVLARLGGVPEDLLYCWLGNVNVRGAKEYHFGLAYYSAREQKMVRVDSTYYPTAKVPIEGRPEFQDYLNRTPTPGLDRISLWVDYLFNETGCWRVKV